MGKSNDLIIAILIYEMNIVIKKIKENIFKKILRLMTNIYAWKERLGTQDRSLNYC